MTMNTFLNKCERLTREYPQKSEAFKMLLDYFRRSEERGNDLSNLQLTPTRLKSLAGLVSDIEAATLISILIREKIFDRFLVVSGPQGGVIKEFRSFAEIPSVIHSVADDVDIEISSASVKTVYRVHINA